jgi:hypothetical protein
VLYPVLKRHGLSALRLSPRDHAPSWLMRT